jgi:hypothetical protein
LPSRKRLSRAERLAPHDVVCTTFCREVHRLEDVAVCVSDDYDDCVEGKLLDFVQLPFRFDGPGSRERARLGMSSIFERRASLSKK